jgi:hypothetical protein
MKFKIGDKVRPTRKCISWYLSEDGQSIWINPKTGYFDESHDTCMVAILSLLLDKDLYAEIVAHNWPGKECENYRIHVLGAEFNIAPEDLRKVYNL